MRVTTWAREASANRVSSSQERRFFSPFSLPFSESTPVPAPNQNQQKKRVYQCGSQLGREIGFRVSSSPGRHYSFLFRERALYPYPSTKTTKKTRSGERMRVITRTRETSITRVFPSQERRLSNPSPLPSSEKTPAAAPNQTHQINK